MGVVGFIRAVAWGSFGFIRGRLFRSGAPLRQLCSYGVQPGGRLVHLE